MALLVLAAGVADASTVVFRTDAELIALSDRVVHGRVVRQRVERPDGPDGAIYTVSTLAVLEDLTGVPGREVETWELGGTIGNETMWVGGGVTYEVGSTVLVCLERGRFGFRSVAMGFSRFAIEPTATADGSLDGRLTRQLADVSIVGGPAVRRSELSLAEFRDLASRVRGVAPRRNPEAQFTTSDPEVTSGFTFLGPFRWTEADAGTAVNWYLNTSAPSPLTAGDGIAELQLALQAWTAPTSATILLHFAGTTNQSVAKGPWTGISSSGTGVVTFEDPSNEISGSVLAIGGGFAFSTGGGTVNGQAFGKFTRGYVIFQNAADLSSSFRQSTNFARVLEHEIGHTIGLGHSELGTANIMHPSCCSTSTPTAPSLGPDDLAGLNFIYPSGATQPPPPGCSFAINPGSFDAPAAGTSASVSVTAGSGCSWSAAVVTGSSFLSLLSGVTGSGSGTVVYAVTANSTVAARSGTLTVAGQTFTVTQSGGPCAYTLSTTSATSGIAGGGSTVSVSTAANCTWTASTADSFLTVNSGSSVTGSGTVGYSVAPNSTTSFRVGTITIAGQAVVVTQSGSGPTMSPDRPSLRYGAIKTLAGFTSKTPNQTVKLLQSGAGTVAWTATPSVPWITVSPTSGIGPATLTVGVIDGSSVPGIGSIAGAITFTYAGAGTPTGPVAVTLSVYPPAFDTPPIGAFDTPLDNSTGVAGAIAVSGWALDSVAVTQVRILRDPVAGEGSDLVPIGTATFVDGTRSDVAESYSHLPIATRGGWGYLMLTNFLPAGGDGTFRLYAYADDGEGRTALLGTKVITCANTGSARPFGTIDTPAQGDVISGSAYPNFGWVLARGPVMAAPPNGQVTILVDGVAVGSPTGWTKRSDLTGLFPAATYPGVVGALGLATLNTTTLSNGLHTIAWFVTADNGLSDGIGSRFFTVDNAVAPIADAAAEISRVPLLADVNAAALDRSDVFARRGYDLRAPLRGIHAGADGRVLLRGEELDRFELWLGTGAWTLSGHVRTSTGLTDLPVGSHLDAATGVFTWNPSAGFLHSYDLVFVRWDDGRPISRREVNVTISPRGSRLGPQVTIDVPSAGAISDGSFVLGGWAIDLDADTGTGIGTIHVWAYPVDGGLPIFLGVASTGPRPDVAAFYGDQFEQSGFGLIVEDLPAGTYDLAVFPWSNAAATFGAAKVVRVIVR